MFNLYIEDFHVPHTVEHFLQRRNLRAGKLRRKPGAEVQFSQFGKRLLVDEAGPVRSRVDRKVMADDQNAIG